MVALRLPFVQPLINMMTLKPHDLRKSKLPPSEFDVIQNFRDGAAADNDFFHFLDSRPPKIAISMLKSQKAQALRAGQEKQELIHSEVSAQREAVVSAQWAYFESALRQDHLQLHKVQQVPSKVKAKLHEKMVVARKEQSDSGAKATKGYQDSGDTPPCFFLLWFALALEGQTGCCFTARRHSYE